MATDGRTTRTAHRPPPPRAEIVVGIDESPASAAALRWAAEHARSTGLPLRLVHAWQITPATSAGVATGGSEYVEAASADARARATRWVLDTLGREAAGVRWTLTVHEGSPGPVLTELARGARLVVVGTRVHTGLRRAVTGSVSHYVLSHADGPVLAVPAPDARKRGSGQRDAMVMGPLY